MAKIIKYLFLSCEVNHGTEENPNIEQTFLPASIKCKTQVDFDANYPIVEKEAVPGSITIEDDGQEDPVTPVTEDVSWDELAAAIREGVNEA